MSRTSSTQRGALDVVGRPGGSAREPGPSGSLASQPSPTQQVITTLHQLIDALSELSTMPSQSPMLKPTKDLPLLLDAVEAGKLLSVSRSKVLDLASQGAIPSIRVGGSVRIPRDLLTSWIAENTRGANSSSRMQLPAWVHIDRSNER